VAESRPERLHVPQREESGTTGELMSRARRRAGVEAESHVFLVRRTGKEVSA
jgi:hypothetical protein